MRLLRVALFLVLAVQLDAQTAAHAKATTALQRAATALQREDFTAAETMLRAELKIHPSDAETLSLLGAALDGEKKLAEADAVHHRAMVAAPRSATILARFAEHLLLAGDAKGAGNAFRQALTLDPGDRFANIRMAQAALQQRDPAGALAYLDRIPLSQQDMPEVAGQKLVALDAIPAKRAEATALFERLAKSVGNDANLGSSIGWTLAQVGQYDQAETFLTHAHSADPSDFHVLYDLGVVALYAGHHERAREVLETAAREQPRNVDVLYSLAFVEDALHQPDAAIRWLVQASQLAPERADVQRLLAVAANELNDYEGASAAWDRYAKLAPNDDEARRERGYANTHLGKFEEGAADLEWYVARHPDDAMGYYELGTAQSAANPTQGIANLDKAVARKPDFMAARAVRGSVYYTQGKPEAALPDLEAVATETHDSAVLDRLGQTYLALNRLDDAIAALRKAMDLPGEPTVLLHLANALAEAGQTKESEALLERYRQKRPAQGPVDLVHFLSLTPEEQRADYRARVEKAIKDNPTDAVAQSNYLKLQLEANQMDQAAATARAIAGLKPGAGILADDGRALLEARQYGPAKALLSAAAATGPSPGVDVGVDVDLAIATFHSPRHSANAAQEGLRQLDAAPAASRNAGYYLARAQMLDASGKTSLALTAMDQAIAADPARAESYWQDALMLSKSQRTPDALRLLEQAAKTLPNDSAIPLIRATVLERSGKTEDALRLLDDVQRTWPEVAGVWVARGIILAAHQRFDEARRALETGSTHGARSAEAWACLAEMTLRSAPDRLDAADTAVSQALRLAPEDKYILELANRITAARQKSGSSPSANARAGVPSGASPNPERLFDVLPPGEW